MSVIDESMVPMLETFIYETSTLLEQLDEILLNAEKEKRLTEDNINEIFRTMHTIKGSAAMMGLNSISTLAHRVEDMFFIIREDSTKMNDGNRSQIFDLLFYSSDFFKSEVDAIQQNLTDYQPADASELIASIEQEAAEMKNEAPSAAAGDSFAAAPAVPSNASSYYIRIFFDTDIQMENIRAFALLNQLKDVCAELDSVPKNPELNPACSAEIVRDGFLVILRPADRIDEVLSLIRSAMNVRSFEDVTEQMLHQESAAEHDASALASADTAPSGVELPSRSNAMDTPTQDDMSSAHPTSKPPSSASGKQSLISVNQSKLDQLMAIMGEIVIAESMVASNPELRGLQLDNFHKSTRQLRKLTDQLQDVVMSIRMVPLSSMFQKMNRIVRDMNKKLGKNVELVTEGGSTEVDKTINDVLADPFMHMIRNSMDHGIESAEERIACGKDEKGTITLSAQNAGGEIVITIADDGRGLDRDKLLAKAEHNGLLTKPANEYTDKEAYSLIMLPGFSTNEVVTEFSGRGVGMDVVRKNLEVVGGNISVDAKPGFGTTFTIKIPLTLAIVDGMEIAVHNDTFTIPITSIKQTFKLSDDTQLLTDTDGSEMIMLRGECFPIIRLHQIYQIDTDIINLEDGIFIQVENDSKTACLFVDQLIGEQQVVVKPFPTFLSRYNLKDVGFSGCTIMGDGSISLILDVNSFLNNF